MARDTTAKISTETPPASEADRAKELEADIAALREDIAAITATLGDLAKDTGRTMKREAERTKNQALEAAEEIKDKAIAEYEHYEDELQATIRERPITSVLVAAGIGFIISRLI